MKFLNSDQSFSWNIFLTALWLKFETSAHSQIAITRSSTLFTNFLTCHEVETLYWDTSRKTKLVNYFINLLDTFFKNLFWSVNWTVLLPNLLRPNFTFIVCVKDGISSKALHTRMDFDELSWDSLDGIIYRPHSEPFRRYNQQAHWI